MNFGDRIVDLILGQLFVGAHFSVPRELDRRSDRPLRHHERGYRRLGRRHHLDGLGAGPSHRDGRAVVGVFAAVARSDLKFPEPLYAGLTIYLLVAIGFKGGVAMAEAGLARVWLPALAAIVLGGLIPLWTYPVLRRLGRLSAADSASSAARRAMSLPVTGRCRNT